MTPTTSVASAVISPTHQSRVTRRKRDRVKVPPTAVVHQRIARRRHTKTMAVNALAGSSFSICIHYSVHLWNVRCPCWCASGVVQVDTSRVYIFTGVTQFVKSLDFQRQMSWRNLCAVLWDRGSDVMRLWQCWWVAPVFSFSTILWRIRNILCDVYLYNSYCLTYSTCRNVSEEDLCKWCCRENITSSCLPYDNGTGVQNLPVGMPCMIGYCNKDVSCYQDAIY